MPNNCRKCQQGGPCNIHKTNSCNLENVARTAMKVNKMSDVKSPLQTGYPVLDQAIKRVPYLNNFNPGFTAGKIGSVIQNTYEQTCKKK